MFAHEMSAVSLRKAATCIEEINEQLDDIGFNLCDDTISVKFDAAADALSVINNYLMETLKSKERELILRDET